MIILLLSCGTVSAAEDSWDLYHIIETADSAKAGVEFGPDNEVLAIVNHGAENMVYFYEVGGEWELIDSLDLGSEYIADFSWHPNKTYFAIGTWNDRALVYSWPELNKVTTINADGHVDGVDFSNDGNYFTYITTYLNTTHVGNWTMARTDSLVVNLEGLEWSHNSEWLSFGGDAPDKAYLHFWPNDGTWSKEVYGTPDDTAFSHADSYFATAESGSNNITVLNVVEGTPTIETTLTGLTGVDLVDWHPKGGYIATHTNGRLYVYESSGWTLDTEKTFFGDGTLQITGVEGMHFSPNGELLALSTNDEETYILTASNSTKDVSFKNKNPASPVVEKKGDEMTFNVTTNVKTDCYWQPSWTENTWTNYTKNPEQTYTIKFTGDYSLTLTAYNSLNNTINTSTTWDILIEEEAVVDYKPTHITTLKFLKNGEPYTDQTIKLISSRGNGTTTTDDEGVANFKVDDRIVYTINLNDSEFTRTMFLTDRYYLFNLNESGQIDTHELQDLNDTYANRTTENGTWEWDLIKIGSEFQSNTSVLTQGLITSFVLAISMGGAKFSNIRDVSILGVIILAMLAVLQFVVWYLVLITVLAVIGIYILDRRW